MLGRRELSNRALVEDLAREIRDSVSGRCLTNEPLSRRTSFRVGGPASLYAYPDSADAVCSLLQLCHDRGICSFVIGYGTNLLVSDAGFAGCVVDLANACRLLKAEGGILTVGAGIWLNDAVRFAAEGGMRGLERLAGIPGGLGGGLAMNCGAFGAAISDHLTGVEVTDSGGLRRSLKREDIGFGYRSAPGLAGNAVLEARFSLESAPAAQLVAEVEATISERFRRNVMNLPSAGSVFKNPPGQFAARLIEESGGKGRAVGGVAVSRQHANFIVNGRGGSAADIVALIRRLRRLVRQRHGVTLELEVRTLGFDEGLELD